MPPIGKNSMSLFREIDYIALGQGTEDTLSKIFEKNDEGNYIYNKKTKKKLMFNNGYDRRLVFNALHLDQYTSDEIKDILFDFANYVEDYGLNGVLEFHTQDTTQSSYHIHYWTNDDSKRVYDLLTHYIVSNGYANKKEVHI